MFPENQRRDPRIGVGRRRGRTRYSIFEIAGAELGCEGGWKGCMRLPRSDWGLGRMK